MLKIDRKKKIRCCLGTVAQTYNPSYLGSGDWEDFSLRPAQAKSLQDPTLSQRLSTVACVCHPSYRDGKHK
jgi:hypothetical protein